MDHRCEFAMESFFATLVSASLIVTWFTSTQVTPERAAALYPTCSDGERYEASAAANAASLETAELSPFGRAETGWRIYALQAAATIGTACAPDTNRFAAKLAAWQSRHRVKPTGTMDKVTLAAMKQTWQAARPFIAAFADGSCPAPALDDALDDAKPREGWMGKQTELDAGALKALRRMVAAAKAEDPRIARDKQMLAIVSAYRSPEYDAARCAGGKCNGIAKAKCSAHRTGTAVDLYVGAAPGFSPVSSDDANRLHQTNTPAYRWLVKNAARFGFVNYVFEPWHWEWTGDQMLLAAKPGTGVAFQGRAR
jgi:zinc D-Ala-D-Ala carboxypeptidase